MVMQALFAQVCWNGHLWPPQDRATPSIATATNLTDRQRFQPDGPIKKGVSCACVHVAELDRPTEVLAGRTT